MAAQKRREHSFRTFALISVVGTALAGAAGVRGDDQVLKVSDIKGIVIADSANPVIERSVTALKSGLKARYGIDVPVITEKAQPQAGVIYLGKEPALKSSIVKEDELESVAPGGHIVRCDGKNIVIAGPEAWKTLYGVYAFLEWLDGRYYGCNTPTGAMPQHGEAADIPVGYNLNLAVGTRPRMGGDRIPVFSFSDKPVFEYRAGTLANLRQTSGEWADCRKGLNPELFTREAGSDLWIDHTAGYLVPKLLYYDDHPEYYAMKEDGTRFGKNEFTDHRTPLCISNKDALKIAVERAVAWVAMNQHMTYFPITTGDGAWCQCRDCKALDHAQRQYARRLLLWANPIADAIRKDYPDKWCFTFAYGGSDEPPPDVSPAENMLIVGSIGLGNILFFDHWAREGMIGGTAKKIEDWKPVVPGRFMVCEYVSGAYQPAMADNLAARLRYYRDNDLFGILTTYGPPIAFRPVWNVLIGRLMWNPDLDHHKIAEEAIEDNYNVAAEPIKEFFRLINTRYMETLKEGGELVNGYPSGFYEPELVLSALACFADARSKIIEEAGLVSDSRVKRNLLNLHELVLGDERAFVFDVMKNPASNILDDEMKKMLRSQLELLLAQAGEGDEAMIRLARDIHKVGIEVNSKLPGALELFEDWIAEKNIPMPRGVRIPGGVQIPPEVFMYAGFGPGIYGEFGCPKRMAVAVYVRGNSFNRSHRMTAQFELDEIPGDGAAVLDIFGQDSDHPKPPADIRVLINGQAIYEGQVTVVKKNWSGQAFDIPSGILKKGLNELEIKNISDPDSIERWYERWFMICDARILFRER